MAARSAMAAAVAALLLAGAPAKAELQPEQPGRTELTQKLQPHWLWVNEVSFTRMVDGRAYLIDADQGRMLGMVSGGYGHAMLQLAPDGERFAVLSTHFSRGVRGDRTDVVTLYDSKTLTAGQEVVIPPKRYGGLPFIGTMPVTDDGRFSLIYNFTPEQSVTVVDLAAPKLVGEFPTPGCGLLYPTGPRRFFMQCGDGSLQTLTLGADGAAQVGAVSAKLFADDDPATEKGVRIGPAQWLFFTYSSEVHLIDGAGKAPVRKAKWSLLDQATAGWRIGGLQPAAYHAPSGRLFTLMHEGGVNTHKDPGGEVWVYDAKSGKRLQRIKLDGTATSIAVSEDDKPLLYTVMAGVDALVIYDAASGAKLRSVAGLGDSLTYLQPAPVQPAGGAR